MTKLLTLIPITNLLTLILENKKGVIVVLLYFCVLPSYAQNTASKDNYYTLVFDYIKTKSHIQGGGCDIFNYDGKSYVISVSSLIVGTKNEIACQKVGAAKAKKDMLSFINGSDITSYTELTTLETQITSLAGELTEAKEEFVEYIRESVIGSINQCVPLGGWYSNDKSVYYYAIYRIIE